MSEQFGRYRLDALVGRGGMGEVHRAFDCEKKRVVALKRITPAFAADEAFRRRFRRESALAARLREPHVIPIHDFGEIDGVLFIDMRLVEGQDLRSLLARLGSLPPRRAIDVVTQIAGALDAAHAEGLVHRDVKPSNVLLVTTEDVDFAYLVDFGIARSVADAESASTSANVGTLAYMAPERFTGEDRVLAAADVYPLGCVLHELLTGRPPYRADEVPGLIYAHLYAAPPRMASDLPWIPVELDSVIARALAKDSSERYRTAGEFARAARSALDRTGRTATTANLSSAATPPSDPITSVTTPYAARGADPARGRKRRRLVTLALTAVSLAGAVLTAWTIIGASGSPLSSVSSIEVGSAPFGIAISGDGSTVYVSNEFSDTVSIVRRITGEVQEVPVSDSPRRLVLTPDGGRLLVAAASADRLDIIDTRTSGVVGSVVVGDNPVGVAVTGDGSLAYVTNEYGGTVSTVDLDNGTVTEVIDVQASPTDIVINSTGRTAYVTHKAFNGVTVISLEGVPTATTIPLDSTTSSVALTPDDTTLLVTSVADNRMYNIDTRLASVSRSFPLDGGPGGIVVAPDGRLCYVTGALADVVLAVDLRDGSVSDSEAVGDEPSGLAVATDGTLYVTNRRSDTVSVLRSG